MNLTALKSFTCTVNETEIHVNETEVGISNIKKKKKHPYWCTCSFTCDLSCVATSLITKGTIEYDDCN